MVEVVSGGSCWPLNPVIPSPQLLCHSPPCSSQALPAASTFTVSWVLCCSQLTQVTLPSPLLLSQTRSLAPCSHLWLLTIIHSLCACIYVHTSVCVCVGGICVPCHTCTLGVHPYLLPCLRWGLIAAIGPKLTNWLTKLPETLLSSPLSPSCCGSAEVEDTFHQVLL